MKKSNLISTLFIATIAVTTLFAYSCKKDRIEEPESLNEYEPVNSYLDTKKQQEQEFVITEPSNDTITGNQGTKIMGAKNCLRDANGDTIDYPFSIYLVELYKPKDMIYWEMPTVSAGKILETDGEIRIRATENGLDLNLVCPFTFWMPNSTPNSSMTIFKGNDNGTFVDWVNTATPFTIIPYGYSGTTSTFGWLNADLEVGNGTGNTLAFTSSTDNLQNVGIYIYFTGTNGVMQVYNMSSGAIPNGSSVKIVLIGLNSSGQLFTYTESRTVNGNALIDVELVQTSDANLTSYLNSL
jgi:hypothetical protein